MSAKTGTVPREKNAEPAADLWRSGLLPVLALGALAGLLGIYWDIAWHIDKGRDSFFTPPHNFIYLSILIVLLMSVYGLVRDRRQSPLHLRLGRFRVHPGVLIVAVGAGLELFFAPADELWHRVFGLDVTLWAPMHLIGVTGLTLYAFGGLVTSWVERRLALTEKRKRLFGYVSVFFAAALLGWTMLLLAEYEFGTPAFPMFWQPLLLMGLPVFVLVLLARLKPVPWAATWTAVAFTGLRLLLAGLLLTTSRFDLAGDSRPAIPLLVLSGVAADLLVRRGAPTWLTGSVVAAVTLVSNLPLTVLSELSWYAGALLRGVPAGFVLAIVMAYLGRATTDALEPAPNLKPRRAPTAERVPA